MTGLQDHSIDAKALFHNISVEVAHWAQVAERLDELIGHLPQTLGDKADQRAMQFQEMDALRQALHAITQIASSAADQFPLDAEVWLKKDALSKSVTMESVLNACLVTEDTIAPKSVEKQDLFFF